MLTVFFRYDDYSSLSHPEVDRGLIDIFSRHNLACTFAVVPAVTSIYPWVQGDDGVELPLQQDKIDELRAAVQCGAVDVALHGWRHLANAFAKHPDPSEFKGLSVDEQLAILQRGCDTLEVAVGVRPTVFVPPWNSYDENTLIALERTGFVGISANRYSPYPLQSSNLKLAPMTVELNGMRAAVEAARGNWSEEPIIGVMMHPYDFSESGDDRAKLSLAEFEQLLVWLKAQTDVKVLPISQLFASAPVDRERFIANAPSSLEQAYPAWMARTYSDPVYHSAARALRKRWFADALFASVIGLIVLLGVGSGLLAQVVAAAMHPSIKYGLVAVVMLAFILLAVRAIAARAIYSRGATLLAMLAGTCLGLLV